MQQFGFTVLFLTATVIVLINIGLAWLISLPALPAEKNEAANKKNDNRLIEKRPFFQPC
jgi:hypothetical protein